MFSAMRGARCRQGGQACTLHSAGRLPAALQLQLWRKKHRCVGLVSFVSLSEGVRGLWASLDTVQEHWEGRVRPETTAVALGFKAGCPGAQALLACMAWVVECQAGLEPKATCAEASASSLVSG